jgi:hypothetical protein
MKVIKDEWRRRRGKRMRRRRGKRMRRRKGKRMRRRRTIYILEDTIPRICLVGLRLKIVAQINISEGTETNNFIRALCCYLVMGSIHRK